MDTITIIITDENIDSLSKIALSEDDSKMVQVALLKRRIALAQSEIDDCRTEIAEIKKK